MLRGSYRLFICCLFIVTSLSSIHSYAQSTGLSDTVAYLAFSPMQHDQNLSVAEDRQGNTWVRGHIPSALRGVPLVFQVPSVRMVNYELYLQQDDRWTRMQRNTNSSSGHFKSRFPQYVLNTTDSSYYLLFTGPSPQNLQVELTERNEFASNESMNLLRIGLYYGLALMSVVFNIVFYLIFKDKRFITYCVLLFTTFLSFFNEDGMFYYLSDGNWAMEYFSIWNSCVTAIVSLIFTYYFLGLKNEVLPRHIRTYVIASAILLFSALIYTLTDNPVAAALAPALCFLFAITCLYLAIRRFRKDVYARFLVVSFSLVVLTGILYVLYTRVNSDTFALFDISTFRLVSSIEIICISFAIIFKMRSLQNENEQYRAELNKYLKALEEQAVDQAPHTPLATIATKDELADELKKQYDLTDREVEVLRCLWDGLTNKEIADRLYITVSTTKYHVGNLYVKLDVKNRNQVQVLGTVRWAHPAP